MAIMSGRQAIMEIFRTEGVQYIFGNPGTTEEWKWRGTRRES
jgi:thiamine pyrophosphate-dependent acetolactate synthase large subunit-like protein